jgi:hypothetical protein
MKMLDIGINKSCSHKLAMFFKKKENHQKGLNLLDNLYADIVNFEEFFGYYDKYFYDLNIYDHSLNWPLFSQKFNAKIKFFCKIDLFDIFV